MAEVIGLVSGGAGLLSLAIQLGESATRLKTFYEKVKNGPNTILELSHDLETLSLALRLLERHRQYDDPEAVLLDRCVLRCERGASKIAILIERLERSMQKRGSLGRMYVAFKTSQVVILLDELERTKSDLMLAYQMYTS